MFRIVSPADFLHDATEGRLPTVEIKFWFLDRKVPGEKYEIQQNFYGKKVSGCPPIISRDKESDPSEYYKNTIPSQKNSALLVPYEKLGLLKVLFPQLKIGRYDDWEQIFMYNQMAGCDGHGIYPGEFRCRAKYDSLINLVEDDDLWRLGQPVQHADETVHEMDCIICTKEYTVERTVLRQLAKKMWTGCEEGQDGWESSGETLDIAIHIETARMNPCVWPNGQERESTSL